MDRIIWFWADIPSSKFLLKPWFIVGLLFVVEVGTGVGLCGGSCDDFSLFTV